MNSGPPVPQTELPTGPIGCTNNHNRSRTLLSLDGTPFFCLPPQSFTRTSVHGLSWIFCFHARFCFHIASKRKLIIHGPEVCALVAIGVGSGHFLSSATPSSLRLWRKKETRSTEYPGDLLLRNPMTGIAGCCACTANGQATEPPRPDMNCGLPMTIAICHVPTGIMPDAMSERYHVRKWRSGAAAFGATIQRFISYWSLSGAWSNCCD